MIAETSRAAFRDVCDSVEHRHQLVITGLAEYHGECGYWPTSYELLRSLQRTMPTLDLNAVRPRLTELEGRRRVAKGEKRRCSITGKRAFTWAVASPAAVVITMPVGVALRQLELL
jgi:hypothetical protein